MPWLVDGSNVLGALRADLHSDDAKRALLQRLASFAREKRTRVTCLFDGSEPGNFARHLGAVTAVFGGKRTADDCVVEIAAKGRSWTVVTSDAALAAKVRRRGVEIVRAQDFVQMLERATMERGGAEGDWESYFSDPKNRLKF